MTKESRVEFDKVFDDMISDANHLASIGEGGKGKMLVRQATALMMQLELLDEQEKTNTLLEETNTLLRDIKYGVGK